MADKYYIVPDVRSKSVIIKESSGVQYLCPSNTVLTGRWHKGDENGQTQYEYATLKIIDELGNTVQGSVEVTDILWSEQIKESAGTIFKALPGRVLVGRYHKGDENGYTKYATAIVKVNGITALTIDNENSSSIKESSGIWYVTPSDRVLIGRYHKGDENGSTYYVTAKLTFSLGLKEPAPEDTIIIPSIRYVSESLKESNSTFICPANTVITGRYHTGDENGTTIYQYASLKAINSKGEEVKGIITVEDIIWCKVESESSGMGFDAAVNYAIVGRKHVGDENASTLYAVGRVRFNGFPTYIASYTVSEIQKENSGWFISGEKQVITSRHHYNDENGNTYYGLGTIYCQNQLEKNPLPFDVIVSLAEKETSYPMNPLDYVILSRFRHHIPNANDSGYDKNLGHFVFGNDNSSNFYNVPVEVINEYFSKVTHKRLFNLRPYDDMRINDDGYFIEPFTHLHGDLNPNERIPVFVNSLEYKNLQGITETYVDIWLFFGFNDVPIANHEGDWEHIMVKVVDNKIKGAWLSQHEGDDYLTSSLVYRSTKELEISIIDGREQLTVYCAKGTHALYHAPGKYPILSPADVVLYNDTTTIEGYKWKVTANTQKLSDQPWKLFAGAWGAVGVIKQTTGPLGPWYKRFNFWYENQISLTNIIGDTEIIIVPDKYYLSEEYLENFGEVCEAPENMVMVGRRHRGDENGKTFYLYASLKAINSSGFQVPGSPRVVDTRWTEWKSENDSDFSAPSDCVIIGRQHSGDEKGKTRYKVGRITFNGKRTTVESAQAFVEYQLYLESKGVFFQTEPYFLYIGRKHQGDENGLTYNLQGLVKVQ